ncbi:hypothetical protein SSX86_024127 [Deinandra increscens subsp. villosa]|uniref:SWIM-type domain-containing protein n=1 Tax=Deinandra increscens subsp. villosa TaxID=3103831 RepID=A0AAP0CH62_9ASTR
MELRLWRVRKKGEEFDPVKVYGGSPTVFSLKFNHGGFFSSLPGRKYKMGQVSYVDLVDSDEFSLHDVNDMINEMGYSSKYVMYYHFLIPGQNLDVGLRALGHDLDVVNLLQYVKTNKLIEVYTEHGSTQLSNHQLCGGSNFSTAVLDQLIDVELINSDEFRENGDKQLINVDNMIEGEMISDEDSDFLVDEDNMIEDVEVDMADFRAVVDTDTDGDEYDDGEVDDAIELDDFDSLSDEDDYPLDRASKKLRKEKKRNRDLIAEPFYVGQVFSNRKEIRDLIVKHAVNTRRQLSIERNDNIRFRVECKGIIPVFEKGKNIQSDCGGSNRKEKEVTPSLTACPWTLYVADNYCEGSWVVKTYVNDHICLNTRQVSLCTVSYLAKEIEQIIAFNPSIPIKALQEQMQQKMQIEVSMQKISKAKTMASNKLDGDYRKQYDLLRDYSEELIRSNPGTTVKIDVERDLNPTSTTRQFRRIYICLGALKAGFIECGRQILGLDGCFMKGPFPGQILSAVGIDSNNGIYPVAYAMVEAETTNSWTWFLECLGEDLDLTSNSNFTFISDRQKGIIPAINQVFPSAEHRYCVRHIHENMKSKWRGNLYKNMLWKCATSTSMVWFEKAMKEVQVEDQSLYEWLRAIPSKHWSRASFSGRSTSDILLNNLCEVFNRQLTGGRDKPIITCLEYIREYLMKRIVGVHKLIAKCEGPLTPNATKILEGIKSEANNYLVSWNGANKFQVSGPRGNQCVVDVDLKTCSCRKWELTGIPCRHAVAVN